MIDNSEKLPGKQAKALAALLNNPTVREAAKEAKLSEPTLYRYLRDSAFSERVREARRGLMDNLQTRLQAKAEGAAKILSDIAEDTEKPASVRVAAARIIIESALKVHEQTELIERLNALEQAQAAQKGAGRR